MFQKLLAFVLLLGLFMHCTGVKKDRIDKNYDFSLKKYLTDNFNLPIDSGYSKAVLIVPLNSCSPCVDLLFDLMPLNSTDAVDIVFAGYKSHGKIHHHKTVLKMAERMRNVHLDTLNEMERYEVVYLSPA